VSWYEAEMENLGWVQDLARGYRKPEAVGLRFQHPQTGVRVEMSMQRGSGRRGTTAMIRRIVEHPWSPPSNGRGAGAKSRTAVRTPKGEKRRVPRKARRRKEKLVKICVIRGKEWPGGGLAIHERVDLFPPHGAHPGG